MLRLSALMIQASADVVVSTAAVSLRMMSSRASESRAPFTSTVSLSRSMPFDDNQSSCKSPLTCRSLIKPLVLSLACVTDNSSMITCFRNSGNSLTSTTIFLMSAMVSLALMAMKSSTPKSKGNARLTCPTVMVIPVFSEAIDATFFTAQF